MSSIQINQLCFALWSDGRYYPAVVSEVYHDRVKVAFLDGSSGEASKEHIVDLQEAFKTMDFQGRWQHGLFWYKGTLSTHRPMVMNYDDGSVEQIELRQLRGTRTHCVDLRRQEFDRRN